LFYLRKTLKNPIFGTNDDFILAALTQGKLNGQSYLTTYFLGVFAASPSFVLSNFFPNLPTYSISILAFLVIAQSIFFSAIFRLREDFSYLLAYSFIWIFFVINNLSWNYLNLTWTFTAVLISGLAMSILFVNLKYHDNPKISVVIIPALVLSLGVSLRRESIYLALLLFISLLVSTYLLGSYRKLSTIKVPLMLWPVFISFYFFEILVTRLVSNSNWIYYYSLQPFISNAQPEDNNYLKNNFNNLDGFYLNSNWDESVFLLFKNFMLIDKEYFSISAFVELGNSIDSGTLNALSFFLENRTGINAVIPYIEQYRYLAIFALLLIIITIFQSTKRFTVSVILSIPIFIYFVFMEFLLVSFKLPERIYLSIFSLILLYILTIYIVMQKKNFSKNTLVTLNIIIFVILAFSTNFINKELKARDNYYYSIKSKSTNQNKIFRSLGSDATFVGNLTAIRAHWISPYDTDRLEGRLKNKIIIGWINPSPAWDEHVRSRGFEPEALTLQTLERRNVYYVVKLEHAHLLINFMKRSSPEEVNYQEIYTGEDFSIVEFNTN